MLLFFTSLCVIEPFCDKWIILGSDPYKVKENGLWHKFDLITWVLVYAAISYSVQDYRYFLFAAFLRQFCMQVELNMLLGRPTFYLSDKGIDRVLKNIFGQELVGALSFAVAVVIGWWILLG